MGGGEVGQVTSPDCLLHRTRYVQRFGAFVFVRRDSAFIGALHTMMLSGHRLCLGNGARSQLLSAGEFSLHSRLLPGGVRRGGVAAL